MFGQNSEDPSKKTTYLSRRIIIPDGINDHSDPFAADRLNLSILKFKEDQKELRRLPKKVLGACILVSLGCVLCSASTLYLINNPQIIDQFSKLLNP